MLSSMLLVMEKVAILFLMIGAGYVCSRTRIVTSRGASQMTNVLLYVVGPCLIISSFQIDSSEVGMKEVGTAFLVALLGQGLSILLSLFVFRRREEMRRRLFQFAVAYSNCGFMGLPLAQALMGDKGVIYASVFVVVFNVFVWTQGYMKMSGGARGNFVRKLLLNPGIIGMAIGLPLFALNIRLPEILGTTLSSFANLNTPLSMVIIGTYVAKVAPRDFFSDLDVYLTAGLRLIVAPLIFVGVLAILTLVVPIDATILVTCVILASAPSAGNTVLFSAMFGGDARTGSKVVAVTTLLSILTMPVFTALAQRIAG